MAQERTLKNLSTARPDDHTQNIGHPMTVELTEEHEDFEDNLQDVSFAPKPRKTGFHRKDPHQQTKISSLDFHKWSGNFKCLPFSNSDWR